MALPISTMYYPLINTYNGKKEIKETDNLFETLMGKKAEFRFKFIKENANFLKQIDT